MHDVFTPVPTRSDVIKRTWKLNAKLPGHESELSIRGVFDMVLLTNSMPEASIEGLKSCHSGQVIHHIAGFQF